MYKRQERTREGNDLYYEMKESGVIDKTTMVFGQMNEPPGARMRVAPVSYTHLDVYKRQEKIRNAHHNSAVVYHGRTCRI